MNKADKKRKARKKAETASHVAGVKATGEAAPANVPGTTISAANTTDTSEEMPLEVELTEETKAVEEAPTEVVEAVKEPKKKVKREPEKSPLEVEVKPSVAEMKAEAEKIIEDSNIPEEVKKDITVEIVDEAGTPLEAEPEIVDVIQPIIVEQPLEAKPPISIEEAREAAEFAEFQRLKKMAEIKRLQAELKDLTK